MKQIVKVLTAIILCIAVFFVLLSGLETKESSGSTAMVGEMVPAFKLSDLTEASTHVTEAHFYNEPLTLLNVWAAWCGICKTEHQFLHQLKDQGIPIIGLDYRDDRSAAKHVLEQTGNPYKSVIYDPQGILAMDLGVYGTPTTFLINQQGKILHRFTGALNEEKWQREFAGFFEEK
ncbi:DsbE family thiol:disulfide interchange protein [Aliivibrio fischeri]|uniref:DsbE family thiol:disulfide interchange protein n=1 Tax=Aliivibrio fischeri TaxID=668 RepID=UPI00080E3023|nr:DsbE family thiol:disulfide interchange protein [Aliivibrio fischeri]OCH03023.1 thiol:disulfide interchange protein [Aliivibrio fischeri]OCH04882.1 thiol:disulfide interchange protein [Aliivibrio fischeri]OCH21108.1 thiol:disulfide interchange protein [Aliivibrio fischeri]OCH30008.1 thiol:disulfide interchange protein [Aliivibrio fischeri]OCH60718.1 thiol:disulfide interchange protein [Aliivibrio fischeri]